jgi:hypothetical protein
LVNESLLTTPANSYIISEAGTYAISTKKPTGTIMKGDTVTWLWASKERGGNSFTIDNLIGDIEYDAQKNEIKFRVGSPNGAFNKGNVVLALRDALNNIVWSWHIWLTDKPNDIGFERGVFMDRNIGALTSSASPAVDSYGFVYQWGRKDPFYSGNGILSDEGFTPFFLANGNTLINTTNYWNAIPTSTMLYATQHPMTFICGSSADVRPADWCGDVGGSAGFWSDNTKTEYDPCPFGYKVPSKIDLNILHTAYQMNTASNYFKKNSDTYWYYSHSNGQSVFPTAGRRQGRTTSSEGIGAQLKYSGTSSGSSGRLYYWTTTPINSPGSPWIALGSGGAFVISTQGNILNSDVEYEDNASGCSVRCIKQ